MSNIEIRPASAQDAALILRYITDLAIYENAGDAVIATESDIKNTLFSEGSTTTAVICEIDHQAVGFAVYFFNYSTWLGKHGLYLEDLYVSPQYRGAGAGKALLKYLAQVALSNHCGRLEWSVLDWNEPAIGFYKSLGAQAQDEWVSYRLTGDALVALAESQ
ncbi:MAG: GNAT family N-acetyltransferase [Lysobacterales bacterium]